MFEEGFGRSLEVNFEITRGQIPELPFFLAFMLLGNCVSHSDLFLVAYSAFRA